VPLLVIETSVPCIRFCDAFHLIPDVHRMWAKREEIRRFHWKWRNASAKESLLMNLCTFSAFFTSTNYRLSFIGLINLKLFCRHSRVDRDDYIYVVEDNVARGIRIGNVEICGNSLNIAYE